ncbi:MAG: peptide chain release factor N(5)-glutamine methyltransferase [Desulfovibrionaceae bacterium]|nr:peptide chain release factor N(5)-glutamine methyltransferase [Desulfovibrionaceae bacterium]
MQRSKALSEAQSKLKAKNIEAPKLSAELLLANLLGCSRLELGLHLEEELSLKEELRFKNLVAQRLEGKPLSYLLGHKEFYDLLFYVNEATLIPRPETELLIDLALELFKKDEQLLFADLGTGSGNIGLTLCHLKPKWQGLLLEKSLAALKVAQKNRLNLALKKNACLVACDYQNPPLKANSLDLVMANPPYIGRQETDLVEANVLRYEPDSALFSEEEGLADLKFCINCSKLALHSQGYVLLEHGKDQGESVRKLLKSGFTNIKTVRDLASLERVTLGQKI